MVVPYRLGDLRKVVEDGTDQPTPDDDMQPYCLAFFGRQCPRLAQQRIRNSDIADFVMLGHHPQQELVPAIQTKLPPDNFADPHYLPDFLAQLGQTYPEGLLNNAEVLQAR